jgi:hypothetical protein
MYRVAFLNIDEVGRWLLQTLVMKQRDDLEVPIINETRGLVYRKMALKREMQELNPEGMFREDDNSLEYNGLRLEFFQEENVLNLPLKEKNINTVVCSSPFMDYTREEVTSFLKSGIKKLVYVCMNDEKPQIHVYKNKGTVEKPRIKSYAMPLYSPFLQFMMEFPKKKDERFQLFMNGTTPFARYFFNASKNNPNFKVACAMDDILKFDGKNFIMEDDNKELDDFYDKEMFFNSEKKIKKLLKSGNVYKTFKPVAVLNFKKYTNDELIVLSQYYAACGVTELISFLPDGKLTAFKVEKGQIWQAILDKNEIEDSPVLSFIVEQKKKFETIGFENNEQIETATKESSSFLKPPSKVEVASALSKNMQNQRD